MRSFRADTFATKESNWKNANENNQAEYFWHIHCFVQMDKFLEDKHFDSKSSFLFWDGVRTKEKASALQDRPDQSRNATIK